MMACLMRRFMSMRVAGGDGLLGSYSVFARMASSLAASTSEESNPSKKTKEERSMDSGLVRFLRAETRRMKDGYQVGDLCRSCTQKQSIHYYCIDYHRIFFLLKLLLHRHCK